MDIILLQALLALIMFITTAFTGLLPIKVLHVINKKQGGESRRASWCLTLLSCFAGGVFMGTCFLDIFPHVNNNYSIFCAKLGWTSAYPLPEFFVCCGFFLVYFLEEISIKIFGGKSNIAHGHSHGPATNGCAQEGRLEKPCQQEPLSRRTPVVNINSTVNNGQSRAKTSVGSSASSLSNDKYVSVMTHEIIMDESVRYISSEMETDILKSITFAIAMSFHSVLEGFALGVQENKTGIMTLFISLVIHKGIEAFSVGLQVSKSNVKRICVTTLTILVYAFMTPLGSMLGVMITNLNINDLIKDAIVILLEGLAGGTFIYVTFFEVLAQERENDHSNLIQLSAIVIGFLTIAGLQLNEYFAGFGHAHAH